MRKSWRNIFNGEQNRKVNDAIDYLDENYAFFLTHVLNLGQPNFTNAIPTAAVALPAADADPTDFDFLFNEDWLDTLSVQDTAFIMAHETLHIVLNHLVLARSFVDHKRLQELAKKHETGLTKEEATELALEKSHMQIFNIAADCVINDYLHGNGLIIESDELKNGLMSGMNMVGHNCAHATVTEVFDELMQKIEDYMKNNTCQTCGGTGKVGNEDEGDKGDEKGDGSGEDKSEDHQHGENGQPCPDCNGSGFKPGSGIGGIPQYKELDGHGWMHEKLTPEDIKNLEDMWDQVKDQAPQEIEDMRDDINFDSGMKMAGNEAGAINEFAVAQGVSLAWVELLREIDPDLFRGKGPLGPPPKASWHRRPRKIHAFPETILPVKAVDPRIPKDNGSGTKRPSIVMALDTSGSISRKDAARFIALAQSVPQDKMHLYPCTFTTQYTKLDLNNPRYGSGGTSFSAVEQFIQKEVIPELGHYPKAVVVITDGYAAFDYEKVPKGEEDSWFWLITDDGRFGSYGACPGQDRKLDDFVDKTRF